LLDDGPLRHKLSDNARAFVANERTVAAATRQLLIAMGELGQ